jgi:predicted peptidase
VVISASGAHAGASTPAIHLQRLASGEAYTLALPERSSGAAAAPLVVSLHYGGPVSAHYGRGLLESVVGPALRPLGALMVAPDCPQRAWIDCLPIVLRVIEQVSTDHNIDRKRIVLTGFSKGGIGTWELASLHPELFSVAIVMAARPSAQVIERPWKMPLRAIQATADEVFAPQPTIDFIAQLNARGVDAEIELLDGVTHYETPRFIQPLRRVVPWIVETWAQQQAE